MTLSVLQVLAVLIAAIAMAQSLAHAMEFPGKLRLSREEYGVVQHIYYPGFTIGGISEPVAILLALVLLFMIPPGGLAFWLTALAFVALAAMHTVYWLLIHPVNNFWLKDFRLKGAGASFFGFDPLKRTGPSGEPDWTAMRDQWEYSHIIRAALSFLALGLLTTALTYM